MTHLTNIYSTLLYARPSLSLKMKAKIMFLLNFFPSTENNFLGDRSYGRKKHKILQSLFKIKECYGFSFVSIKIRLC